MISFDEYMGFSESKEDKEKKPGKIKQFFKKHGKKLAIGAAIAAGAVGAGVGGKALYDYMKKRGLEKATKAAFVKKIGAKATPNGKKNEYGKKGVPTKTIGQQGYKHNTFENSQKRLVANTTNLTNEEARQKHEEWLERRIAQENNKERKRIMDTAEQKFGKKDSPAKRSWIARSLADAVKRNKDKNYL